MMYAITNQAGDLVSLGSVVSDSLPDGLVARLLTDAEDALRLSGGVWANNTFVAAPPEPKTPLDILTELPVGQANAGLTALVGLLLRTGEIWTGVYQMTNDNPAKAPLVPIAEELLIAALPLLDE